MITKVKNKESILVLLEEDMLLIDFHIGNEVLRTFILTKIHIILFVIQFNGWLPLKRLKTHHKNRHVYST